MQLRQLEKVIFPPTKNININMMPFIIGDPTSIPSEYRHYCPLIQKCSVDEQEFGKVGYLSIAESKVRAGHSQRRSGLHTERPNNKDGWGKGGWGGGLETKDKLIGGLYMASNVENSCQAWNIAIEHPGHLGSCEEHEHLLTDDIKHIFLENELVWMTDRCPHESMILAKDTYRQWFRFVTSQVTIWYSEHSTFNNLGIQPNCEIIYGSKFASE